MPQWTPQGHHAEHLRRAAGAAAPAPAPVEDWMRRFGAPMPARPPAPALAPAPAAPAAAPAAPVHNWRQNFAPADFLPFQYDIERHMRRMGLGPGQQTPRQPAAPAANPAPVVAPVILAPLPIVNQPPAGAAPNVVGRGTLAMDEFLTLFPHLGVRPVPVPAQPVMVHAVRHLLHARE